MNHEFLQKLNKFVSQPLVDKILISTILIALVGNALSFYSAAKIDKISSNREFIYNFDRAFFDNPKYRKISIALEESYLYNKGKILKANGGPFTDYEIDDYLNLFSELGLFGEEEFVDFRLLAYQFGYYFCISYNNPEIQGYLKRLKQEGLRAAYNSIDDLAENLDISHETDCKKIEG